MFDGNYAAQLTVPNGTNKLRRKPTMPYRILVINPGSTSTKIGVYEDEQVLFDKTLRLSLIHI